jgi:hypothetical protein
MPKLLAFSAGGDGGGKSPVAVVRCVARRSARTLDEIVGLPTRLNSSCKPFRSNRKTETLLGDSAGASASKSDPTLLAGRASCVIRAKLSD